MSKPFQLGVSPAPSLRRASPTYEDPTGKTSSRNFKWTPGINQNQAPLGDVPLPNFPAVGDQSKPFRVR